MYRRGVVPIVSAAIVLIAACCCLPSATRAQAADEFEPIVQELSRLSRSGAYAEAMQVAERLIAGVKARHGEHDPRYATALARLALLHWEQGQFAEAEPLLRRALDIDLKALGPDAGPVARDYNNLGSLLQEQGRYAEAEPLAKRALEIDEKVHGPEHPDVGRDCNNLALMYLEQGRYREAEPLFLRALAITEKALGPEHPTLATRLRNLAALYRDEGRYGEAEPLLKRSIEIGEKSAGRENVTVAASLSTLAKLYREMGRFAEAEALHLRALAIRDKVYGADNVRTAVSLNDIAALYQDMGRNREAEELIERALRIRGAALRPDHPDIAMSTAVLGGVQEKLGKTSDAESSYRRALEAQVKVLGPEHPDVARTRANLGALYKAQGRLEEAREHLERALAVREKVLRPEHPAFIASLLQLAELYRLGGRREDSEKLIKRARSIRKSGLNEIPVFFATDRKRSAGAKTLAFGSERDLTGVTLGLAKVVVLKQPPVGRATSSAPGPRAADESTDVERITIQSLEVLSDAAIIGAAGQQMQAAQAFKKQVLLFVHGYNVSFENAVRRAGQIAYDLGFDGPTFVFSWPSRQRLLGYISDRDTVDVATEHLGEFLLGVIGPMGARKVHVVGHSMGNMVLLRSLGGEASAQIVTVGEVVAAAPDVDPGVFATFSKKIRARGANITVYASATDKALWLSGRLRDRPRVGYISRGSPSLLPGVDLIDISVAGTSIFALNHDVYASSPILISDMRRLFAGERPPDDRTPEFEPVKLVQGSYWKMRKPPAN